MKQILEVKAVCDLISGTSSNGNDWEKQTVIFFAPGTDRLMAIDFMGERKTKITKHLTKGTLCEVVFEIRSREYGDKWYTQLDGYAITPLQRSIQKEDSAPEKEQPQGEPHPQSTTEIPLDCPSDEPPF